MAEVKEFPLDNYFTPKEPEPLEAPRPTAPAVPPGRACSFCQRGRESCKVVIWADTTINGTAVGICDLCVAHCVSTLLNCALAYDQGYAATEPESPIIQP